MGCGGCAKRRNALKEKIAAALQEKDEAEKGRGEISLESKEILEKNKVLSSMIDRNRLVGLRNSIATPKPVINPSISVQSKLQDADAVNLDVEEAIPTRRPFARNYISSNDNRVPVISDEELKIGVSESVKTGNPPFVPPEFLGYVKQPVFDKSLSYPILTDHLTRRKARSILRNEKILRFALKMSIASKSRNVADVAEKYGSAIFDLYLLFKKQSMN